MNKKKSCFECPNCRVYAQMRWVDFSANSSSDNLPLSAAFCPNCNHASVWFGGDHHYFTGDYRLIRLLPPGSDAPSPNPDMPREVRNLYLEAASISDRSPRGAAALLRLGLEILCHELTESGESINDCLKKLSQGQGSLPPEMLTLAHFIRVMGNEAVHPGEIDFGDDERIVSQMFEFMNQLVDHCISRKKKLEALINSQPAGTKAKILKHQKPHGKT